MNAQNSRLIISMSIEWLRSLCLWSSYCMRITFVLITNTAMSMIVSLGINTAQAAPCFDNAQSAYDYLLSQEESVIQARDYAPVNINSAPESELVSLQGIGSSKAQAIILYREMFGAFKTIDELEKVKGIGPKTIEKNRARLRI